jgi:alanyl-tRNA synthetase
MEFEQQADGTLERLPAPSIDTGMGLERIASVLQGKRSNYDTDLFQPLLQAIAERAGKRYGTDPDNDDSMRIIADHVRALNFLVADGVVPANDNRGYVLRRLLRRAIRHGRKLGIDEPFLHHVSPVLHESFAGVYPELAAARDAILEVGRLEEERFADTLATGLGMFEEQLAAAEDAGGALPGKELFRLYDTFGFPLDLARDIAGERGVPLDEAGFEREMEGQRARAQASWKGAGEERGSSTHRDLAERHETRFSGYARLELDGAEVLALLRDGASVDSLAAGEEGEAVLAETPFYAEAGGQVGDRGRLRSGDVEAEVLDTTRPLAGLTVHRVRVERGRLAVGDALRAEVDAGRRRDVARNHTATHLLHAALREVVGTHVKQAGSLVAPDRLRFDFTHFAGVSDRALQEIEDLVNREALRDTPLTTETMDLDAALASGAMALFGEKYGDRVRVVGIGDFSTELCGGTHCARTGEVGLVKLTGERGVASGTRRVEALTGDGSLGRFRQLQETVRDLEGLLATQREDLPGELRRRLEAARSLEKELDRLRVAGVKERMAAAAASAQTVAGTKVMTQRVDGLGPRELRELADELRRNLGSGVVVLGRADASKASLLVTVTEDLTDRIPGADPIRQVTEDLTDRVRAGDLVKILAKEIGGGGGGRADLAEAGGKRPEGLDAALARAPAEVERKLGSTA